MHEVPPIFCSRGGHLKIDSYSPVPLTLCQNYVVALTLLLRFALFLAPLPSPILVAPFLCHQHPLSLFLSPISFSLLDNQLSNRIFLFYTLKKTNKQKPPYFLLKYILNPYNPLVCFLKRVSRYTTFGEPRTLETRGAVYIC